MADLKVYGPVDIPYVTNGRGSKRIKAENGREFWTLADVDEFKKKQGCYIFATRAGRGFRPWYVGQASKGFLQETFTKHKLGHYNDVLFNGRKGNPVLFLVAPVGGKRKVAANVLDHLEKELIQYALKKNPELCNIQNTRSVPEWSIRGVVRSQGKPPRAARSFKTMMGM